MIYRQEKRHDFGIQPRTMITSNVSKPQGVRTPLEMYRLTMGMQNRIEPTGMDGSGLFDKIKALMAKGASAKQAVEKLGGVWSGELGTAVRNMVPSSDENARPQFPGEKHAILKLPNGKYGTANYMGPGTQLEKRLRRGDPPRTMSDRVAMAHDSRYALAKSQKDVAAADRKMIKKLKDMQQKGQDNSYNINMGMRPIQAKLRAESLGLVKPGKIASFGDAKDKALVSKTLKKLEQEGFGLALPGGSALLPGDRLKMKMLAKASRTKKKGKSRKTKGGSLKLAGQGQLTKELSKFTIDTLLPLLLKRLHKSGIPVIKKLTGGAVASHSKLRKVLSDVKGLKTASLAKLATKYAKAGAKHLLPIILKMVEAKMKGSGVRDKLNSSLASALLRGFKWFLNKRRPAGTPELFSGSGMSGDGFWKDFGRGFTKSMKTAFKIAKVVAPVAPLLL